MKQALILAIGLALFGTSAWSQSSPQDQDDYARPDRREYSWHRDRGDDGDWNQDRGNRRESSSRWDRERGGEDQDRGDRSTRTMRDDNEDRSGQGAHFSLRSGDTQLRVVCADRESTRICVDEALRMFDHLQSKTRTGTGSANPSSSIPNPATSQSPQ